MGLPHGGQGSASMSGPGGTRPPGAAQPLVVALDARMARKKLRGQRIAMYVSGAVICVCGILTLAVGGLFDAVDMFGSSLFYVLALAQLGLGFGSLLLTERDHGAHPFTALPDTAPAFLVLEAQGPRIDLDGLGPTPYAWSAVALRMRPTNRRGLSQLEISVNGLLVHVPSEAMSCTSREILRVAHEFREMDRARRR